MKAFVIETFYKFTPFDNLDAMKVTLLDIMQAHNIRGTIILALEGINGTVCGSAEGMDVLMRHLRALPGLSNLLTKTSYDDENPFAKAKVKLRREIVTMGVPGVDPARETGVHVSPAEWNALISDPSVVVIDTRNDYEVMLGTFKGAVNPRTENFRDFPAYVDEHLMAHRDKKVAMFCTGGVRCEKSTALLMQRGFKEVYQLDGGILNYIAATDAKDSLWEGTCFVFDERVALKEDLNPLERGTIDTEWKNTHRAKNAAMSAE